MTGILRDFLRNYFPPLYEWISALYNRKSIKKLPQLVDSLDPFLSSLDRNISFIQIGANDGERADFLRKFIYQNHWSGVMIEPVPYLFEFLQKKYNNNENLFLENVAISEKEGEATIYRLREDAPGDSWIHGLASFDRDHILRYYVPARTDDSLIVEEKVEVLTLNHILNKYSNLTFNLICMDTEGHDEVILRAMDFDVFRPNCIIFEHKLIPVKKYAALVEFLKNNDYRVFRTEEDTLAVQN